MATKLYLIGIGNSLSGTFPTGEQSSLTPSWSLTGASNLYTMRTTKGGAQVSLAGSSLASTSLQRAFCSHFASDTLNTAQSVGGGSNTVTINVANRESNLSMNFGSDLRCNVYVWRPSTGTKVGTIGDCLAMTGSVEPGAANSERSNSASTASTSTVSALAGDVIICEIWQFHTQAAATSYTGDVWASGTTETLTSNVVVTDHASFLSFSADTLTFGTPSTDIGATVVLTLAADTASSASVVAVSTQSAITAQNDSAAGSSAIGVSAIGVMSIQNDSASSASVVRVSAQSSVSLAGDSISATASQTASVSADASITLQGDSVSAQTLAVISSSVSIATAGDSISAQAGLSIAASSSLSVQADSVSSSAGAGSSGALSTQLADDQAQSSSAVAVDSSLSVVIGDDSPLSVGTVSITSEAANQEFDDSSESVSATAISAESESIVAADIMSASVSVGGELTPSPERTLFIGTQVRSMAIDSQNRSSAQISQSRVVAFEPQRRQQTLVAQNRTVAPEPQNRNIAE